MNPSFRTALLYGGNNDILGRGLMSERLLCVISIALVTFVLMFGIILTVWTKELNMMDAALMSILLLCFVTVGYMFFSVDSNTLSRAVSTLSFAACSILLGLIANALFGERVTLVSTESMPYVLIYVSVIVLFLFAHLPFRKAWIYTLGLITTGAWLSSYALLNPHGGQIAASHYWTLICTTLLPLHTAVMCQINMRTQHEVIRLEISQASKEHARLKRSAISGMTDAQTGGLNEKGIRKRLREDVKNGLAVELAVIEFPEFETWQTNRSDHERELELIRMSSKVARLADRADRWGRLHNAKFVVWTGGEAQQSLSNSAIMSMTSEFATPITIRHAIVSRYEVENKAGSDPAYAMLLEADHRLFINTLDDPIINDSYKNMN